jgi:MoaA/NifB/PqqE/SkfB family radical SAM enzyme
MPRPLLLKFLQEVRDVPTARVVVFTGGEPTLRRELLLEGIRLAKEGNLLTRVVTNGYWAVTPERAEEFARRLREAGLQELNTSFDDFHAPFVRVQRIANVIRAALAVGLRVGLGVVVDKNATFNATTVREAIAANLAISVAELEKRVAIVDDHPAPTGTGSELDVTGLDVGDKLSVGCPQVLRTVSIHPNGLVKACCGHAMFYAPDLTVGNLLEESLADILARGQTNLVYWWIHMLGPKKILEKLGVNGRYSHICHACHVLLSQHRDEMLEYLAAHRDDVLLNDVLLSDGVKRAAQLALDRKEEILSRLTVTS